MPIENLRVRSLDVDLNELSWTYTAVQGVDIFDLTFQIFRSESPSGPFDAISPELRDQYLFVDNQIPIGDRWRQLYYVVRVAHKPTGRFSDTPPVAREPEPDLYALEIRRHMQLLFREHAGRRCWVLPVRTFGPRCACWNPTLGDKRWSRCPTCFDTTFVGGYLHPIETWVQFDPSPKANQSMNVGQAQQVNTTARLGYYPPLKPKDLIIEGENRRWTVVVVSQTEHARAPVHQELQLHEIPLGDIEFAIPLNLGVALRDLWLSPERNYSLPTDPQNVGNTFPGR